MSVRFFNYPPLAPFDTTLLKSREFESTTKENTCLALVKRKPNFMWLGLRSCVHLETGGKKKVEKVYFFSLHAGLAFHLSTCQILSYQHCKKWYNVFKFSIRPPKGLSEISFTLNSVLKSTKSSHFHIS